jgi:hypothetical protein
MKFLSLPASRVAGRLGQVGVDDLLAVGNVTTREAQACNHPAADQTRAALVNLEPSARLWYSGHVKYLRVGGRADQARPFRCSGSGRSGLLVIDSQLAANRNARAAARLPALQEKIQNSTRIHAESTC